MAVPPNILWIVTTQWRASATGYAGDVNARTPWLDGLASEAVNFTEAVTPHPFGPQARAALLTGQRCPDNGVSDYWDPLPADARTVAHALGDRGYETAFFGKWHLAERDRTAPLVGEVHAKMKVPPARRGGFALWEGFESGFLLNDPWLHGSRLPEPRQFKGYQAEVLAQRAGEWCRGQQARRGAGGPPSFCVVSMESPHPPYHAPAPHVAERAAGEITLRANVPRGGEVERQARSELAGYYAHIEATDRAIGQLIAGIDGQTTTVVFTSVHGDMHGAHGLFRKGWPYEESVRVPLLIRRERGAGSLEFKQPDRRPVSLVDLPHMAVAWAEGRPWACTRDHAEISMPSPTALPQQCPQAWRGFRSPQHKLILNAAGEPWLYFDLERDPLEQQNLVAESTQRESIARLRALV